MTIVARTFRSVPQRSASATWDAIVDLVAPDQKSPARRELAAVAGVACSCIADEALADDALVVHGAGPRVRVYALYGEDAIEGEGANESPLSFVPTDGDWRMSIPCLPDDLLWVQRSLAASSTRVTARSVGEALGEEEEEEDRKSTKGSGAPAPFAVDRDAFFRR